MSSEQSRPGFPCPVLLRRVPADDRIVERYHEAARRTVAELEDRPGRPAALRPFDSLMTEPWRAEQVIASGRKVVGTLCNFVPEPLVLAAGAVSVRLDLGHGASAAAGSRAMGGDVCPAVRAIVGAHLGRLPWLELCDLLVVPTACDGKKKLARFLDREVWVLQLPQDQEGRASRDLWQAQVRALAERLQRLTGQKIRRRALRRAIELTNRRTALARRLMELLWSLPSGRLSAGDYFLVMQASFLAEPGWWVERTGALVAELDAGGGGSEPDPDARRILLTGSPLLFPDFKLLALLERAGARVVADDMCSGTQRLYNPVVADEWTLGGMLRACAHQALLPCTCPCFVSGQRRIDRVLELARLARVQGAVHHTLRLCQPFDLEQPELAAALGERSIPLLSLHTEYSPEDAGQLTNRIEAFVEMVG